MKKKLWIFSIAFISILLIGGVAFMIYNALKKENAEVPQSSLSDVFVKKDIYSDSLYHGGIFVDRGEPTYIVAKDPNTSSARAIVLPMVYGKCYEFYFPKTEKLTVAAVDCDPLALSIGEKAEATELRHEASQAKEKHASLMYIPKKSLEYLVIYTGGEENTPITIYEQTILAEEDTVGPWYRPAATGGFLGGEGSFADYRWSSDEVYENLYEPLRKENPSYITREHIGKDQSGAYDMYCYIFAPEGYEQTVFLSSGMHSNEEDAYFALAYFMKDVANAKKTDAQLYYLKNKVRFIVIPLINVYGVNRTHDMSKPNWSIRYNSTETDLNRDFGDQTQQETKNVCAVLEKYGDSISFGIDFHTTPNDNGSDLFFNFNVNTQNEGINFQTANHIYHRMKEEGMIAQDRPLLVPSSSAFGTLSAMDGKYSASRTLQSYLWNEHGIPPITVEYMNFTSGKSPAKGSCDGLTMAVEIFGNFIIQNALCFAN